MYGGHPQHPAYGAANLQNAASGYGPPMAPGGAQMAGQPHPYGALPHHQQPSGFSAGPATSAAFGGGGGGGLQGMPPLGNPQHGHQQQQQQPQGWGYAAAPRQQQQQRQQLAGAGLYGSGPPILGTNGTNTNVNIGAAGVAATPGSLGGGQTLAGGPMRPPIDPSTGHDYRRADDGTTHVDLVRVHALLARRLACKMSRKYDEADRLRQELRELGVEVQDKMKVWTARPVAGSRHGPVVGPQVPVRGMAGAAAAVDMASAAATQQNAAGAYAAPRHQHSMMPGGHHGVGLGGVPPTVPQQPRHVAGGPGGRGLGGFGGGGGLQQQQQQAGPQARFPSTRGLIDPETGHDYRRADNDVHAADVRAIDALIARRLQCKMAAQYAEADRVRQRLRVEHGVEVQDRDKIWRVVFPKPLSQQHPGGGTANHVAGPSAPIGPANQPVVGPTAGAAVVPLAGPVHQQPPCSLETTISAQQRQKTQPPVVPLGSSSSSSSRQQPPVPENKLHVPLSRKPGARAHAEAVSGGTASSSQSESDESAKALLEAAVRASKQLSHDALSTKRARDDDDVASAKRDKKDTPADADDDHPGGSSSASSSGAVPGSAAVEDTGNNATASSKIDDDDDDKHTSGRRRRQPKPTDDDGAGGTRPPSAAARAGTDPVLTPEEVPLPSASLPGDGPPLDAVAVQGPSAGAAPPPRKPRTEL